MSELTRRMGHPDPDLVLIAIDRAAQGQATAEHVTVLLAAIEHLERTVWEYARYIADQINGRDIERDRSGGPQPTRPVALGASGPVSHANPPPGDTAPAVGSTSCPPTAAQSTHTPVRIEARTSAKSSPGFND